MRVSSIFNAIVRPMIYSTVTLEAGVNPFDTTKGADQFVLDRISPDMSENVELVKHVIVKSQPEYGRGSVDGLFLRKIDVASLVICPSALMADERCLQCPPNGWAAAPYQPCQFIRMYRPRKLVLFGARIDSQYHDLYFDTLKTVVYVVSASHGLPVAFPIQPTSTGITRIVQIFWTERPAGLCVYPIPDPYVIFPVRRLESERYVRILSRGVCWLLKSHHQLDDMIIVNSGYIPHLDLNLENPKSRQEKEIKFEAIIYKTLSKQPGIYLDSQPGQIIVTIENQIQERNIKITFISLRDYLKTHDWTGEFTEKAV